MEAAPPDDALIEAGRKLFAGDCRFVTGAASLDGLPATGLAEIAFAGRSNVGKSSLINALTGRRTLARISRTPGRTQQINFFALGDALMLVDLPGYGYARAAKTQIKAWTALVDSFLRGRPMLRRVYLLIDARHGAKDSDIRVMAMLDQAAVVFQAVLTKADKTKPGSLEDVCRTLSDELARHPAAHPGIAVTSARGGAGIAELRAAVAALAAPRELG
ncbi:MAG: YihA family ribosome biogenesis GTP-binding protein [Proteobacteria bacterium]|nr:YihA family ribosome biogenesis GTP-binding protein [Pseudomonadota bacterium]